jgi:hypothetical protein
MGQEPCQLVGGDEANPQVVGAHAPSLAEWARARTTGRVGHFWRARPSGDHFWRAMLANMITRLQASRERQPARGVDHFSRADPASFLASVEASDTIAQAEDSAGLGGARAALTEAATTLARGSGLGRPV